MQSEQHRQPDDEMSSAASSSSSEEEEASLLEVTLATLVLFYQTWVDRVALLKAEASLALSSLMSIALLVCSLALVVVVAWVIAVGGLAYYAITLGVSWVLVVVGMLVAQGLLAAFIIWQIKRLSRHLTFPATRTSFSKLQMPETAARSQSRTGES